MALPKGQAFAVLEGGQLWKLRMPLPDTRHDPQMPRNLSAITTEMDRRYHSNALWYRDTQPWWTPVSARGDSEALNR